MISEDLQKSYLLKNETAALATTLSANVAADSASAAVIKVETDSTLSADSYKIYEDNGVLHLAGGQTYSALLAVRQFAKMISDSKTEGTTLAIPSGYVNNGSNADASASEYHMTWSDEFSSAYIYNNWTADSIINSGVNGKGSVCNRNQVSNSGGITSLKAKYDANNYYGAQISTAGKMSYTFGYVETRVYIPIEQGMWPGFWARSTKTNGGTTPPFDFLEIDAFERFGAKQGDKLKASVLKWFYDGTNTTGGQLYTGTSEGDPLASRNYNPDNTWTSGVSAGWHIIGFDWSNTYVKFICDGEVFYTFDYSQDFTHIKDGLMWNNELYLLYSLYVGSDNSAVDAPSNTGTNWNEQYKIDWVQLYQNNECYLTVNQ